MIAFWAWPGDGPDNPASDVIDERTYLDGLLGRVVAVSGVGTPTTEACRVVDGLLQLPGTAAFDDALRRNPSAARCYLSALYDVSEALQRQLGHLTSPLGFDLSSGRDTAALFDRIEALVREHRSVLRSHPQGWARADLVAIKRSAERVRSSRYLLDLPVPESGGHTFGAKLLDESGRERREAGRLRVAAMALVAVITLLSFGTLYGPLGHPDPLENLTKLVVTLPLAALAAFLGRESGRHRRAAERLWGIGLPIAHLAEVGAEFDPADRRRITEDLVLRVPVPVDGPPEAAPADAPSALGELSGVLENLPDVIRAVRGG